MTLCLGWGRSSLLGSCSVRDVVCGTLLPAYLLVTTYLTNEATRGFRFWEAGFWKGALGERPYHISALFVVDLVRFRSQAATVDRSIDREIDREMDR